MKAAMRPCRYIRQNRCSRRGGDYSPVLYPGAPAGAAGNRISLDGMQAFFQTANRFLKSQGVRQWAVVLCLVSTIASAALTAAEPDVVKLRVGRSLLLHAKADVYRTAIVDSSICEVTQYSPRELSIIARSSGQTEVTFWFDDPGRQPRSYVIEVR